MMNSKLPKYIFDWKGAITLFVGALGPAMFLSFLNVLAMMFMKENFVEKHKSPENLDLYIPSQEDLETKDFKFLYEKD